MSGEITGAGDVVPPLNITAPTPILSLRGFQWGTADSKVHGSQPSQDDKGDAPPAGLEHDKLLSEQVAMAKGAASSKVFHREAIVPPSALPQLPRGSTALPPQLPGQLGHKPEQATPPGSLKFPLHRFQGAYAGNGFNLIFRPRSDSDRTVFKNTPQGPKDNILQLNLTTEQLTFGVGLGKIPNRGLLAQENITLAGLPCLQTIQDVTNPSTGRGDRLDATDIHFEPGVWLYVPAANFQDNTGRIA